MSVVSFFTIFLLRSDLKPGRISLSHPPSGQTRMQALLSGLATLDFGGIFLFIFGIGLIILGTAWGGSTFPWSSGAVISSIVLGAVLILLFLAWESLLTPGRVLSRRMPRTVAMIPSSALAAKDVSLVCFIAAATGAALYSVFYFIGIYFTLVEAYSSSHAGTQLLYYVPGIGVGVYLAIFICNVYPRQTFYPLLIGTVVETAGIAVLAYATKVRDRTLVNVMMGIAGAGTGMRFMPSSLHLSGMFRSQLAAVYSLLRFAMPFGGTLALTIMGSVFQNKMSAYFGSDAVSSNGFSLHNSASLDSLKNLPAAQQNAIRAQGATATMWSFISILPILALSLFASAGLGNVWIPRRKSGEDDKQTNDDAAEKGEEWQQVREDGTCRRHAAAASDAAAGRAGAADNTNHEKETRGVEFITSSYILALLRGDVRRLKRSAAPPQQSNTVAGEGAHLLNSLNKEQLPKDPSGEVYTRDSRGSA